MLYSSHLKQQIFDMLVTGKLDHTKENNFTITDKVNGKTFKAFTGKQNNAKIVLCAIYDAYGYTGAVDGVIKFTIEGDL